jgi:SAM-dependent methyltransferase
MNPAFQSQPADSEDIHVWLMDGAAPDPTEFDRYLRWIRPGDRVMDIGSGEGRFLQVLKDRGIEAFGVDLNENLAGRARAKGLKVLTKDVLVALDEDVAGVTIFCMMDFVEHIPLRVLLEILRKIARVPGARVLLQTPNLDSVIGMKFYFHLPSHVTPLHPFFLRRVLAQHGLGLLDEWSVYGQLPWRGLRRRLTIRLLRMLFGPPVAQMFIEGANICMVAAVPDRPEARS